MVIAGDFKIELVDAETKRPFKEHSKDGQTYVEVEPDVEYYVSYQRIFAQMHQDLIVGCLADGKHLGWERIFENKRIYNKPTYLGTCNWEFDGDQKIREDRALVFAKPTRVQDEGSGTIGQMLMGKIEFQVFEKGDLILNLRTTNSFQSEMSRSAGSHVVACVDKKQVVSSVSETSSNKRSVKVPKYQYTKGALLQKITLHYCTVPGLMKAGIVSKPPNLYDYHRMITKRKGGPIKPLLVQPQLICKSVRMTSSNGLEFHSSREQKYCDFFDLSTLNDNDNGSVRGPAGEVKREPSPQETLSIGEGRSNKRARN